MPSRVRTKVATDLLRKRALVRWKEENTESSLTIEYD
jgi:hypothetical protein